MTDLTPREKEMLAALKAADHVIENAYGTNGLLHCIQGSLVALDWGMVKSAIAKLEPAKPPRRWVVECVYQGRDESPIQERHNYISNIIREVKPITRAQLNALCYAHDSAGDIGMLHELRLLGIEVED